MAKTNETTKRSLIPTQQSWENAGDCVEGTMLSKEDTVYQDKTRGRYMINTSEGLKVFMGAFQIDQALQLVSVGDYIHVEYTGVQQGAGVNKMKLFNIWLDDGEEAETEGETEADNTES